VGDAKLSDLLEQRVGLGLEGRRVVEEGLLRGGLKVAELRGDLVGDLLDAGQVVPDVLVLVARRGDVVGDLASSRPAPGRTAS
jgi:hypothetical protein